MNKIPKAPYGFRIERRKSYVAVAHRDMLFYHDTWHVCKVDNATVKTWESWEGWYVAVPLNVKQANRAPKPPTTEITIKRGRCGCWPFLVGNKRQGFMFVCDHHNVGNSNLKVHKTVALAANDWNEKRGVK